MTHPIVACASDIRASLKAVATVNPTFMTCDDKATALTELVRAEGQLAELRLRVLADAGDLAVATAARDAAGWLAKDDPDPVRRRPCRPGAGDRAGPRPPGAGGGDARRGGDVGAGAGDPPRHRRPPVERGRGRCCEGGGAPGRPGGGVRSEGARPARAPDPRGRGTRDRRGGRSTPVGRAGGPRRRPDPDDHAPSGDGTTRISGRVPDASATRFATYLEADANPRRHRLRRPRTQAGDPFTRLPYPSRLGQALAGSSSPSTPPGSRSTAATPRPSSSPSPSPPSRTELAHRGPASAAASCPVTRPPATSSPQPRPDASRAPRRSFPPSSAATASPSTSAEPDDCSQPGQRKALLIRDTTCRAEGCDVPGTWCDAHHLDPWSTGGRTDLTNGAPALQPPSPPSPRHRPPHRPPPQRRPQVPPTQIGQTSVASQPWRSNRGQEPHSSAWARVGRTSRRDSENRIRGTVIELISPV